MVAAIMKVDYLDVLDSLSVEMLPSVRLGQQVKVYVEGTAEPVAAQVVFISPTVATTGKFAVKAEFANPPLPDAQNLPRGAYRYRFRDGMKARIEWSSPGSSN
jgi:hypothetical protein